ncbi:hypothetical protein [Bradyrhizobium sp. URHD0069]|uniref:hypothetical protein n=1 Tax=Bradyrhizobium sp. URHD0069 TaxID=1380355 RepID=UPI0004954B08|nr:hypothetical protein [Bradyrhizobium sp. URHD0069]
MGSGWIAELIKDSLGAWNANPIPFLTIAVLFGGIGYVLSRLRHQGRIDTLSERVRHRDDQIKMKDEAIAAASKPTIAAPSPIAALPEPAVSLTLPEPSSPAPTKTAPPDERFRVANEKIARDTEAAIRAALRSNRYRFVYNPLTNKSKPVKFNDDGEVGEGRNGNEYRWRISNLRLEIINDKDQVYSRFFLLPDKATLHHTNDPDLPSLRGQYFVPMST